MAYQEVMRINNNALKGVRVLISVGAGKKETVKSTKGSHYKHKYVAILKGSVARLTGCEETQKT